MSARKKLSANDMRKARDVCHFFDVTVFYSFEKSYSSASPDNRSILMTLGDIKYQDSFWSIVFHELAHIECYDKLLYERYHHLTDKYGNEMEGEELYRYMRKTSLKAERFVDNLGEKSMKTFFPELEYKKGYESKNSKKFIRKWVDDNFGTK